MNSENDIFEQIRLFLPKYLTPEQKEGLFSELSRFPESKSFYLQRADLHDQLLQGDGWQGLVAINFVTGARRAVSGVIISNSCDVSADNPRYLPPNVLFAPLIELGRYVELLIAAGKTTTQIENIMREVRKQRITNLFYLPELLGSIRESLIVLDDMHRHPLEHFLAQEHSKLFTLNQYAFYIFLIKLSIHFARFQEGVQRFEDAA